MSPNPRTNTPYGISRKISFHPSTLALDSGSGTAQEYGKDIPYHTQKFYISLWPHRANSGFQKRTLATDICLRNQLAKDIPNITLSSLHYADLMEATLAFNNEPWHVRCLSTQLVKDIPNHTLKWSSSHSLDLAEITMASKNEPWQVTCLLVKDIPNHTLRSSSLHPLYLTEPTLTSKNELWQVTCLSTQLVKDIPNPTPRSYSPHPLDLTEPTWILNTNIGKWYV